MQYDRGCAQVEDQQEAGLFLCCSKVEISPKILSEFLRFIYYFLSFCSLKVEIHLSKNLEVRRHRNLSNLKGNRNNTEQSGGLKENSQGFNISEDNKQVKLQMLIIIIDNKTQYNTINYEKRQNLNYCEAEKNHLASSPGGCAQQLSNY